MLYTSHSEMLELRQDLSEDFLFFVGNHNPPLLTLPKWTNDHAAQNKYSLSVINGGIHPVSCQVARTNIGVEDAP